jgi:hypothetical protein
MGGRQALKESEARLNGTMMRLEAELGVACEEVTYLKHQLMLKVRQPVCARTHARVCVCVPVHAHDDTRARRRVRRRGCARFGCRRRR